MRDIAPMLARFVLMVVVAVGACRRPDPAPAPVARPLLWTIERDGVTSYAFATMHQGVDPATGLAPIVWSTLDRARAFVMETDLSRASTYPVVRSDGTLLHDELGPTDWAKLEAALGHDEATRIDGMKPMIAGTLLALRGLPPTPAMDAALLAHARSSGKPVVFLETIEDELAALEHVYDARMLHDALADPDALQRESKQMLAAYIAGDEAAVREITMRDHRFDALREALIDRRNASWIDGIERMHANGGGFIAVGAAHLVGPRSVLALLAERGYRITRIR